MYIELRSVCKAKLVDAMDWVIPTLYFVSDQLEPYSRIKLNTSPPNTNKVYLDDDGFESC